MNDDVFIHPTAIIEEGVSIGNGTSIWNNVHIRENASIGSNCIVGEKTYVAYDVKIGNLVKINAYVYICTGVSIKDRVMIAAGTAFTNDKFPRATKVGQDTLMTSEPTEETLETIVNEGVTIGVNATIGPGISLGEYCMVGMGSVVTRDVPAYTLVYGVPATIKGYICKCGHLLKEQKKLAICSHCGLQYDVIGTKKGKKVIPLNLKEKKTKMPWISELLGWALIIIGVIIMGGLIYRSVRPHLPQQVKTRTQSKQIKTKPKVIPPLKPVEETKQVLEVKEYLKKANTQLVEGFASIESFSRSGNYESWRGKVQSWWEYSEEGKDHKVVWHSGKCPEKKTTTLVFSGVLGVAAGEGQLYVKDKPVLIFNTGRGPEIEEWKKGDFRLKFFAMKINPHKERFGIFCLTIPEEEVTAGKSIKLKVTGYKKTGRPHSYFMISGWPNSLQALNVN